MYEMLGVLSVKYLLDIYKLSTKCLSAVCSPTLLAISLLLGLRGRLEEAAAEAEASRNRVLFIVSRALNFT
jgi:hypothetical protein